MITAIYSLSFVHGAELWILFWFLCLIAYLGICFAFRTNRTKSGRKTVLVGLLIAEVLIDLVWAIVYYHNGTYLNYGIGAVYGIIMRIPVLAVTAMIVSLKNRNAVRQ